MPFVRVVRNAVLIFSALGAAWSAPVLAKCAGPHAIVSPPGGSVVPASPTIYFFFPKRDRDKPKLRAHSDGGGALDIEQSVVAETESFTAYRLQVKTQKPGAIVIDLQAGEFYYGPKSWRFNISADWRPPASTRSAAAPVVSTRSFAWTCSHQLSQNLKLPGRAAAYRVAIHDFKSDGSGPPVQELIVPPRMMQFFERNEKSDASAVDEIELGHINCFGNTFAWQNKPILVDVFALQPDGSESRLTAAPMHVDMPLPVDKNAKGYEH